MSRNAPPLALAIVFVCLTTGCRRAEGRQPGDDADRARTQPGSAAAQSEGDRAGAASADCNDLPSADDLKKLVRDATGESGTIGGLFGGKSEWVAVVNRQGEVCAAAIATDSAASGWQGSAAIAKAKAYTANAFSTDTQPMSTARLYTLAQPGHSLYGAANANPFNPACLATPDKAAGAGEGQVCGGTIVFGGGLPLYRGKTRVGGLGASGDTACADHEVAKRIRHLAKLDPEKGEYVDDIVFTSADGPSIYAHPLCPNTWRNGKQIGDEKPAASY